MRIGLGQLVAIELRKLGKETSARLAVMLFVALSLLAIGFGWARVRADRATVSGILAEETARYQKLEDDVRYQRYAKTVFGDLTSPGLVGVTIGARSVTLPPGDLAVLAVGQRDVVPVAARIWMQTDPFSDRYDALQNPRQLALGPFDFVFVVVYVFPLLVFSLSFDLVSAERERGTLQLLLSQTTSFGRVLLAKILSRLAVLGLVTVLVVGVAVGASRAPFSSSLLVRIAATDLAILVYGSFWFALALTVQRLRRSSQTNALLLLAAWLAVVVVLPTVIDAGAKAVAPMPPRVQLFEATREAQRKAAQAEDQALDAYYGDHPDLAKATSQWGYWTHWVARSRAVEAVTTPLDEEFDRQLAAEQTFVERLSVLSPAVSVHSVLTDVAGADQTRERRFVQQARKFAADYRRFFEERVLHGQPLLAEEIPRVPAFSFAEEISAGPMWTRLGARLAQLTVPTALLALLAFTGMRRVKWLQEKTSR